MRAVAIAMLVSLSSGAGALAAQAPPLAPGKPAGVHQAQETPTVPLLVTGAALVGIGIALAVAGDNTAVAATSPTTTTTTTSTTGTSP